MSKHTDLFIAQQALIQGWITPVQLSASMKLCREEEGSLAGILVHRNYLNVEQLDALFGILKKHRGSKEATIICCKTCKEGTSVFDYQPDEVYLCSSCKIPLPFIDLSSKNVEETITRNNKFGVFTILSEIGRGGMGMVYKVKHPELDIALALKVLVHDVSSTTESVARFYREIELASKLRHPNIVGIHDVGAHNGCPYYTMDYVEGQTLGEILQKSNTLPEKLSLQMMEKIACGLAAAHRAKIIHRDLKPENIIVDSYNKPYLMDFGIAKCREKLFKPLTKTGTIMGTPYYMSPEQAKGQTREISFPSDVYSLGITLYQMLTGKLPFTGKTPIDVITKVVNEFPLPPRALNSSISRRTEAVVMKAMAKSVADRYPNASALVLDLRALLKNKVITARPVFWWQKMASSIKRHAFLVICLMVTCIAVTISILFLVDVF